MAELKVADYKHIDVKIKSLLNGYIRGVQLTLPHDTYHNIPPLINNICALFYYLTDKWDKNRIGSMYEINGNKVKVAKQLPETYMHQSTFLENIVYSNKHHWKFKISVYNDSWYIVIGIIKNTANTGEMINTLLGGSANTAYGMDVVYNEINVHEANNDWSKANAIKCKESDIVDMYLDLDKLELSIAINDIHYGKTHDIDGGCGYSAAVTIKDMGNEIELVAYDNQ